MLKVIFNRIIGFLLLCVLLCLLGYMVAGLLPVLMYPQTRRPMVTIRFSHPGISAVDFQRQYSDRIEPRLTGLGNVDLTETVYSSDSSSITLTFDWNIKSDDARAAVESLMFSINSGLPAEIRDSYSIRFREGENAGFIVMGATSATVPPEDLLPMLRAGIEGRISSIEDVDEYGFYGTEELTVEVILNQRAMLAAGLTIVDIDNALQASSTAQPLGTLRENDNRYSLRYKRSDRELSALPRLEVGRKGDSIIALQDVAAIDIRYALPSRVFLIGGKPAIQLSLTPVEGGNLNRMTERLTSIVEEARAGGLLPADTDFKLYLDPAKYINRSIANVIQAALIGGLLAVLIVFVILGELRNTLIIAMSIPVTILLSFIFMYVFKVSINLISLGGLALAVGMIIDPTIVVMENIHRWRNETRSGAGTGRLADIVMDATRQVRAPIIASALTSVLVFLPLTFTAPLAAAILGDQAKTVVFSLLMSLVVSLSLVPVAAFLLFGGRRTAPFDVGRPRGFARISDPMMVSLVSGYRSLLRSLIAKRSRAILFLVGSFVVLGLSLVILLPRIPKELISKPKSDRVVVFFRNDDYSEAPDVIELLLPAIEERIDSALSPMKTRTFASVSGRMNQVFVDLESPAMVDEAVAKLEREFVSEGPWYFNIGSWDPAALPLPQTFAMQASITGSDAAVKVEILDAMQRELNASGMYGRTFTRPSTSVINQLDLTSRIGILDGFPGLSEASLTGLVRRVLSGTSSGTMMNGDDEVQVSAAYSDTELDARNKLENFLIPWRETFVPLKHFFDFRSSKAVSQIFAENGEPVFRLYASVSADMTDAQRADLEAQARSLFQKTVPVPVGYGYTFDNPRAELDEAIRSLMTALVISVALIYLLLSVQFNSLKIPLVILVTVPLGFIGVVLSLFLFRSTLNLNSLLGTILLCGIVVNNAIILMDFYLNTRKGYANRLAAIEATAAIRFKPILITTLTTVFGMMPIALGLGSGSNILQPLGIAVSGGLAISTALTLFAVPAILSLWRLDR
ncbi:MAG: efflux RND transporter permease subunit [Spirochaetales bacterium]|nr:MAG: efflux RND transporter permease subunit [Spirochaetales bacterium]